ncbi:unnamed protein product [Cyberlindnera jadinii]|uniref:Glutathione S-transferase n=1 Tax=Cyberlindnera jadinii (strain ATCC 18201 / CBS 1600 / BCRC 20928 / JCM 3617 / NBRC 0987 / NRRL Y-1542) TaxID=983966 RepID=A0A0H5C5X0_CYBJN|nr:unnamed protein product [Cyberlindnera jadinii]
MTLIDEGDPDYPKLEAPYLKLYSLGTPNGQKITVYLELLGLKYHYRNVDILKGTQKEPWFLKLNPNGRIPVLSDVDAEGHRTTLFETGAILQYLGEKYDKERKYYYDLSSPYYWDQVTWLTFQVASHAPYQGQASHFLKFAKEDVPYGKKRYKEETERVFGVYELRLKANNGWLVGDHLNIVDIAAYPWIRKYDFVEIDITKFPELEKWLAKIDAIEGIEKGLNKA